MNPINVRDPIRALKVYRKQERISSDESKQFFINRWIIIVINEDRECPCRHQSDPVKYRSSRQPVTPGSSGAVCRLHPGNMNPGAGIIKKSPAVLHDTMIQTEQANDVVCTKKTST